LSLSQFLSVSPFLVMIMLMSRDFFKVKNKAIIEPLTAEATVKSDLEQAHPWGRLGVVEDIARAAVFLASEDASWVTGVSFGVFRFPFVGWCPWLN